MQTPYVWPFSPRIPETHKWGPWFLNPKNYQ
jgi:hypothetical protein